MRVSPCGREFVRQVIVRDALRTLFVVAAGDQGEDYTQVCDRFPVCYGEMTENDVFGTNIDSRKFTRSPANVITVAGVNLDSTNPQFYKSNTGPGIDIAAISQAKPGAISGSVLGSGTK